MPHYRCEKFDEIFDFIVAYKIQNDGQSPTYREIMESCHLSSTSLVAYYLSRLVKAGKIAMNYYGTRSIRVPGGSWNYKP